MVIQCRSYMNNAIHAIAAVIGLYSVSYSTFFVPSCKIENLHI